MRRREKHPEPALPRDTCCALRWFVLPVLMLALILSSALAAQTHALSHSAGHKTHTTPAALVDTDSATDCCDEHEQDHAATPCAVAGPCVGCATADADKAMVHTFSTECPGSIIAALPAGRNLAPAKQPPRMFLQV
jgi:hypothetical protein